MAFSNIVMPAINSVEQPGGPIVNAMKNIGDVNQLQLNNAMLSAKLPFVSPQIQAQIKLLQQHANLFGSEAAKNAFQVQNPAYMNPDSFLLMRALTQKLIGPQASSAPSGNALTQPTGALPVNNPLALPAPSGSNGNVTNYMNTPAAQQDARANGIMNIPSSVVNAPNNTPNNAPYGISVPGTPMQTGNPTIDAMMAKRFGVGPAAEQQLAAYGDSLKQQVTGWNEDQKEAHSDAAAAFDANQNLKDFIGQSDQLGILQGGALGGNLPAYSDARQKADNAAANLVKNTARAWQSAHITNQDIQLMNTAKINVAMNKETREDIANMALANNNRVMEKERFLDSALNGSLKMSVQQANHLWDLYQQQRPAYNSTNFITNTPYENTWGDYLNEDALNAVKNGKKYIPDNQKDLSNKVITQKDIENTAAKYGKTPRQVLTDLRNAGKI